MSGIQFGYRTADLINVWQISVNFAHLTELCPFQSLAF